jgi:hypothetical protein
MTDNETYITIPIGTAQDPNTITKHLKNDYKNCQSPDGGAKSTFKFLLRYERFCQQNITAVQ